MVNGTNGNRNGTVKVSVIVDWAFRILTLALPPVIGVMLNLQHRVTVIESNRYTARQGQITERTVVALEERYRALKARIDQLQRELDRLEGH